MNGTETIAAARPYPYTSPMRVSLLGGVSLQTLPGTSFIYPCTVTSQRICDGRGYRLWVTLFLPRSASVRFQER